MEDALFSSTKADVVAAFTPHLARLNPAFDGSWIRESWMFAAPFAQPIVTVDYRDHIPPFETPVPGLYVANMFQVYPHDRGQNYSFALAERLIHEMRRCIGAADREATCHDMVGTLRGCRSRWPL